MANEQNLIPQAHKLTVEEQSKGGIASAEARRKKRTLMELMSIYGEANDKLTGLTNDEAMVVAQYALAKNPEAKGSTQAAAFIRDTKGEKPHEVLETPNIEYKPLVDLTKRKKNGTE